MTTAAEALPRINVMKPWLGEDEVAAVTEVLQSGWVAQGPRVAEFERAFAEAMQATDAVATSSCTNALQVALLVAGVGAGDDVVVPSLSFIATANAPTYVGARPVFADVDAATGNVTVDTLQAAVTDATRAVIVVDQGGIPVDLDPIRAICDPRGIVVIEDAACAAGSTYHGRPVGSGAEIAAWSFHPRKILTTGEGGMITTSRPDWAIRARRLREHAMSASAADRHADLVSPPEEFGEVGFNFRMTDLQAAVGLVQLAKLPDAVQRRRQNAAYYRQQLTDVRGIRLVDDPACGTANFQSLWLEVDADYPLDREGLLLALAEVGISARRGIMAAHRQPAYRGRDTGTAPLPVTDRLTDNTLILPLFHQIEQTELDRVITVIRSAGAI
ncbi:DegT/DnrJ/EryC1/StrS family aminotransferase [Microlunatus soli]|uniref:dTDP-4-amino-4,6-dideoxygalactose transaminase n=1 Tax=Microlunatus soli TaxID=630515 RepID=A0A1H1SMJ5_9ACTN|nr:DegT/DnrJ/EryC1/StrS family aminotransferase [Microlunatus soli]SDS49227.1 dTDP-4-amino-4,6-dideoxygalactose transaminase [Microlunatus soli]